MPNLTCLYENSAKSQNTSNLVWRSDLKIPFYLNVMYQTIHVNFEMFSWQKFWQLTWGQALCFAHKIPTQMCTEQILAISGSFACTNCTKYKLLWTRSRQWSACCPVECKPWACNKISNFTRGLTFTINDLHFHAMCILEIFLQLALSFLYPFSK